MDDFDSSKYFLGTLCKRGHRYNDTNFSLRCLSGKEECCVCVKEYRKEWYLKNKEHVKEHKKEWYLKNKEHVKEHSKEWNLKNKEHAKEHSKKWYLKNKEHAKEHSKKWYLKNKEHKKEYRKKWYLKNKEHAKEHRLTNMKMRWTDELTIMMREGEKELERLTLLKPSHTKGV